MKINKKNRVKNKIEIAIITMFFLFSFFPYNNARADWWGAALMSEQWAIAYNRMMDEIANTLLGSLKQAAFQTINNTVNNAISQGASGPMFITNWEDFLINDPQRKADLYMNDFFSSITSGRGGFSYSSSRSIFGLSYNASGEKIAGESTMREGIFPSSEFIGNNYQNLLVEGARNITINSSIPKCEVTDPSGMFKDNNWSQFATIVGVDSCNKFGFNNIAQTTYSSIIEKEQKVNSAIGQAGQGFLPKMSGNTIITPGSTIAAIQAQTEDLGNKIIAAAKSPQEVITSLVTKLATRTIQQGIGQAQQYAQREINNQMNGYTQQIRRQTDPRNIFKPNY